mgnify:CR=1 FL=1
MTTSMNKDAFLCELVDLMDLPDPSALGMSSRLQDFEEWDSLAALSLLVLLKNAFNLTLSGDELRSLETVSDIWDRIEARSSA